MQQSSAQPACLSRTASSPSQSSDTNFSQAPIWPGGLLRMSTPSSSSSIFLHHHHHHHDVHMPPNQHQRELQLLPTMTISDSRPITVPSSPSSPITPDSDSAAELVLSIGPAVAGEPSTLSAERLREEAREQMRLAMGEKSAADEARMQAKRQIEIAEKEFNDAKKLRQHAQAEFSKACVIRDHAIKRINSMLLQITCQACKNQFRVNYAENSLAGSYMSSVVTEPEIFNRIGSMDQ